MAELVISDLFEPAWAVPPGVTIAAILSSRSLSRESFAEALGESVETVQRLLPGLEAINIDLADRLSRCLGSSRAFWLARERQFRVDSERLLQRRAADEREIWVRQFPVKEMASLGWIGSFRSSAEAADECLKLFGVPDVAAWQSRYSGINAVAAFRISTSPRRNPEAVTAWLRWAELIAERTPC
jgi:plasmid maintenance system antidote protein VapI